jgi:hypothetical protein
VVAVLEAGVRGPFVPVGVGAAEVGLEQFDAAPAAVEVPRAAYADVLHQRARPVLREDRDVEDAGVHAVGEREVDKAVAAAEGDRGLRAAPAKLGEPLPLAAGEDECERVTH